MTSERGRGERQFELRSDINIPGGPREPRSTMILRLEARREGDCSQVYRLTPRSPFFALSVKFSMFSRRKLIADAVSV